MILKSFLLGNLVSLCMKIINSVVVVGLYYGFLTTFSIGPSYLFLLRARVMEEGTEKKVSATTGFIAGQLMMFISIHYAPLHLALGRPHTITVLALPYLLFHFFWNNHKNFFDYGSTTRNSMRNLRIQCVFLNNLIFQLFNHFILPSSMLARLVNIYMFRCNNKMLFVTSSFVGWLIGHILFMKWVGLVLVWIQQNHSIRSNVLVRSNKYKYLVSELRNSMARIFSILLFITCVYYLGRIPSPIFTKKLKGTSETEERGGAKQDQEVSTEEDPSLFSEEREDPDKIDEREEIRVNGKENKKKNKDDEFHVHFKGACYKYKKSPVIIEKNKNLDGNQENLNFDIFKLKKKEDPYLLWEEKPLVTLLFDYKRWNRPFRYIKNLKFFNAVRNEMSQYFFYTCQSDEKKRISFTYPPSLLTFLKMIEKKVSLLTREKRSFDAFFNHWSFTNEKKKKNLKEEFIKRVEVLDKGSLGRTILEKRTQFCNNEMKKEYLPKKDNPFLHGSYRGRIKKFLPLPIITKTYIKNNIGMLWINKIHSILLNTHYHQFKETIDTLNIKLLSIEKELSLIPEHQKKKVDSEPQIKILKFLFDVIRTDSNDQKIRKNSIEIKEIRKKVLRWSYKLIDDLEQQEGGNEESIPIDHQIRSRKGKNLVILTDNQANNDIYTTTQIYDQRDEVTLIGYSQQSDFRRDIIKGSMRAQRRKTVIWELFQPNVHSQLFFDKIEKPLYFSFDISSRMKLFFLNLLWKNKEKKNYDYTETKKKKMEDKREKYKRDEKIRIKIAETWDTLLLAQVIRGSVLVTHSILRQYIILPSLIIIKNIARMLLFQFPEWSEDFKDWNREIHVKCTYNGVQLSEKEFPKNWLTEGIQIKILFPFWLKPWHKSQLRPTDKDPMKKKKRQKKDFCFLTFLGMETELPFGSPRKRPSFFEPIFQELKKKIRKSKTKCFVILRFLKEKERAKFFLKVSKETRKWVIKSLLVLKRKKNELSKKNPILLFELRKIDELNETKKDSIIKNRMIPEGSVQICSMWTNYSLTENKMKDLTDRTSTIRTQIEQIPKDKTNGFLTQEKNISSKKRSYNIKTKILESSKTLLQILKRRNARLIRKSYFFFKFFIEGVYMDVFLCIINSTRINTQLFLESKKKIFDKSIYNNEVNQELINKTNEKTIQFISIIKNSLSNIRKINSKLFFDLSFFSQAYVFYKFSLIQIINLYKLRSALQYHGTSFFLKNEIKFFFDEQRIFPYELRHKTFFYLEKNKWKNWFKSHYQYDLPKIRCPRLVPEKWQNRATQHCLVQNKDFNFNNRDSYEKEKFIHYKRKKDFETDSLLNLKFNLKKNCRYDLLLYKSIYINYKDKLFYNYNIDKCKFFNMLVDIPIQNYLISNSLGEDHIMDIDRDQIPDRKYFDCRILHFCLRKKVYIESWVDIKNNKNIKTGVNNYQIIEKLNNKKSLFYFTISQDQEIKALINSFDWMGMNEEIRSRPIWNLELLFFPKFSLLYNTYKIQPWVIPIKSLLFNFNEKLNKKITEKKKGFISFNEKNFIGLENQNKEEKLRNIWSVLLKQEKKMEEDYAESDIKKRRKKKKYQTNTNTQVELGFLLKKYLRFQLRWEFSLNQRILNNIKLYRLLLRLRNPREVALSSIQRGEMRLDILIIQKSFSVTELPKRGILIIEPVRLAVKNAVQFYIYQTLSISLVHKTKKKKKNQEKSSFNKKTFDESIARYQRITANKDKNDYDFLVPEKILSPKRCREFRILICFNLQNRNAMRRNQRFENNIKKCGQILNQSKDLDRDQNNLIKWKVFFWPNFRLEDLACINRYWFNTTNGSRFSMVRIHMYPRLKIR
nr:Ycf1 protein [Tropaeolum majus]UVF30751.1 Ycf1 protein [Tropaeolum majus]UVF31937.1 Ycf1 protein [Tropaeolum majus]UVF36815.1 Ycf1 protein [Tropaeolum majus]